MQNLWIHPVAGGDPVQVTKFTEGRINGYRWNKAGTRLIAVRILGAAQSIWTIDAASGEGQPVAEFRSGLLSSVRLAEDGSHVSYVYGDNRVEVVMIQDTGE